jgi:hypothetical protein
MATAAEKQLADFATEKEQLRKRIAAAQERIATIETMEAALQASAKPAAAPAAASAK